MSNSVIERINKLIERAAHANTGEEEARSCALMAVKLLSKHPHLKIVDSTNEEKVIYAPVIVNPDFDSWESIGLDRKKK